MITHNEQVAIMHSMNICLCVCVCGSGDIDPHISILGMSCTYLLASRCHTCDPGSRVTIKL